MIWTTATHCVHGSVESEWKKWREIWSRDLQKWHGVLLQGYVMEKSLFICSRLNSFWIKLVNVGVFCQHIKFAFQKTLKISLFYLLAELRIWCPQDSTFGHIETCLENKCDVNFHWRVFSTNDGGRFKRPQITARNVIFPFSFLLFFRSLWFFWIDQQQKREFELEEWLLPFLQG